MPRALAIEVAHLVIALGVTIALFWAAAWAYPQGRDTIWAVGWVTAGVVVILQIPPILRAGRKA